MKVNDGRQQSGTSSYPQMVHHPAWDPVMLQQTLNHLHEAAMCSWYAMYSHYHPSVYYVVSTPLDHMVGGTTRTKRRKLDVEASTSRLIRSRGDVTFKPYTDDLIEDEDTDDVDSDSDEPRNRKTRANVVTSSSMPGHGGNSDAGRLQGRTCGDLSAVNQNAGTKEMKWKWRLSSRYREEPRRIVHKKTTTIGDLFPEILSIIFKFLDVQSRGRVARVCRLWRDVAYEKSIWKETPARLHLNRPNPHLYPSLIKRGIRQVQVLSLKRSLRDLIRGLTDLEELNLSGCYNLSDAALDLAFKRDPSHASGIAHNLRVLNLSLCKDVSDNSLSRIALYCKGLESLDLSGCSKITNMGLLIVSLGLKKLKRLNLRSCRQVSDYGIGHLAGIHGNDRAGASDLAGMSKSNDGLMELEVLELQDCQKLTDESLKHIANGLKSIKSINLSFCICITDTGLKYLASMPSLESLNLRSCDNISDLGISYLSDSSFASLKSLDVSFCANVTYGGVKHMTNGLQNLEHLCLTTCSINDKSLQICAENLKFLRELNIGQCADVTDGGIMALVKHAKNLQLLDIYGCAEVSKEAIKLVKQMPSLKKLIREL